MASSKKGPPSSPEVDDTSRPLNRRRLLALGGANDSGTERTLLRAYLKTTLGTGGPSSTLFLENTAVPGINERARALHGHGEAIFGITYGNPTTMGAPAGVRGHSQDPNVPGGYGPATGVSGASGSGPGVESESSSGPGVRGRSTSGRGVSGWSDTGRGVSGQAPGPVTGGGRPGSGQDEGPIGGVGVYGESAQGAGVVGHTSADGQSRWSGGVVGLAHSGGVAVRGMILSPEGGEGGVGVGGSSAGAFDPGTGGLGAPDSTPPKGVGVFGSAREGVGVHGRGALMGVYGRGGIGVRAEAASPPGQPVGVALDVVGKARFSTAGAGLVPAKAEAPTVANTTVTAQSHITVTFTGDPGQTSVVWVERLVGTGFVIHLSRQTPREVPFTYLIVEPAA